MFNRLIIIVVLGWLITFVGLDVDDSSPLTPTPSPTPSPTSAPTIDVHRGVTLRIQPPAKTLQIGESFLAAVEVNNITDLYGLEVFMEFEPTVLGIRDSLSSFPGVNPLPGNCFILGDIHTSSIPDMRVINNVIVFAASRLFPAPAISGSCVLFYIEFEALQQGNSPLSFVFSYMLDRQLQLIAECVKSGETTQSGNLG